MHSKCSSNYNACCYNVQACSSNSEEKSFAKDIISKVVRNSKDTVLEGIQLNPNVSVYNSDHESTVQHAKDIATLGLYLPWKQNQKELWLTFAR